MILNYDKKFIVFMPWKTAGSTLHKRLSKFNQSPYSRFYHFNPYLKRIVHQHICVADFKALPENLIDFVKISFVRNPYDRVYSGFIQIQKDLKEKPLMPFDEPWIRNHVLKQLATNEQKLRQAHYNFNEWVALLEPEEVWQTGGNSSLPLHPSHYWTHDAKGQFVDFIGKVETFEEDFIKMLNLLGITEDYNLENDNVELMPTANDAWCNKYLNKFSSLSLDKVNLLFEKDFQLFGYRKVGS